jgi:hypothetical protein
MSEASDLNDWFNAGIVSADAANRLHFRAASFCMGDATDFDAWDQGICSVVPFCSQERFLVANVAAHNCG